MLAGALRGLAITIAVLGFAAPAQAALSVLDNGTIRVGVDLLQGGKVTWLSLAQGDRADNLLFEAEQSYYGGRCECHLRANHFDQEGSLLSPIRGRVTRGPSITIGEIAGPGFGPGC